MADMESFQWNAARFSLAVDKWISLPNFKYDPGKNTSNTWKPKTKKRARMIKTTKEMIHAQEQMKQKS